jgi:branched-chain amino acid transport system substrate-binding protein
MINKHFFGLAMLAKWPVLAAAVSLIVGVPAAAQDNTKPIKIGILAPYTGVFAAFGPKMIEAPIRLYLQQHGNKIGGRSVEVVVADDQSKANVEIEKARELIESQKVDVIIGLVNSAGALAARDYLDKQKVITLITVAGARELTQSKKSDSIFRLSWANGQTEPAGAVMAKLIGLKSMVGIGADYVAAHQLLEPLIENFKKLGGTVPLALWSPLGTADFSSYLAQIKEVAGSVDAVSPMLFGADGVRFFNQYREFGIKTPLFVFGDVTEQTVFLDQVGEAAIGTKAYWNYSPYLDNPVNNEFRIAYKKAFDRLPGGFSFHAYAAMQFLEAAVAKNKGDIKNFEGMKKALETTTIESPAGPLSFDKDHNVVHNIYLTEIKKGPDGIVAQIPMGPMITNVTQYQTLEEAQKNLTDIKTFTESQKKK